MKTDELKDLLANATPGPWSVCTTEGPDARNDGFDILGSCISGVTWIEPYDCEDTARANARLIALAPQLAADNIALQAEVERLREALSRIAEHSDDRVSRVAALYALNET